LKSKMVKSDYVDIGSFEADANLNTEMKRQTVMIKTLPKIEESKRLDFIKLIFGADIVTKDPPQISSILTRFDLDTYARNSEAKSSDQIIFTGTKFLLHHGSIATLQQMNIRFNGISYDFISDAMPLTIDIYIELEPVSLATGSHIVTAKINPETMKLLHKYRNIVATKLKIREDFVQIYELDDTIRISFKKVTPEIIMNEFKSKSKIVAKIVLSKSNSMYFVNYIGEC